MSLEIVNHDLDGRIEHSSVVIKAEETLTKLPLPNNSDFVQLAAGPVSNEYSRISVNNRIDSSGNLLASILDITTTNQHKKEFKKFEYNNELYEGEVLLNNLHGQGFFFCEKNGQKLFYDGLFYVNKLEGYSQIFYDNGTHFQGLFKQHKRYGPGVLTYPNGSTDVGFWNGFSLIRLTSVVGSDTVPRLVTTALGKTKLLCYKYLVPLGEEHDDFIENIFTSIGASAEVLKRSDEVLNLTIRNPSSLFFHKKFFDRHFFGGPEQECTIKVVIEDKDQPYSMEDLRDQNCYDEDSCHRIARLKSKLKEIDESLEPFLIIKQTLLAKIFKCSKCCEAKDSSQLSSIKTPSDIHIHSCSIITDLGDNALIELGSIKPDSCYFDASLPSVDTTQEDIEEALDTPSAKLSSKQEILDFCICGEEEETEDLHHLEEQLINITRQETFYRNIRDNLHQKVDNIIQKEEEKLRNEQPKYKLVEISEVWAWNNEELMIDIQKHCFKHRNSEEMVNFSVPNLILGHEKDLEDGAEHGEHEQMCRQFLRACGKGKKDFVRQCLRENINPNVSDARGNSGVFFAAARNQIEIVPILTNFGAKLDQINDEELTPLTLCILKYLSLQNSSDNWEKAFLSETQLCKVPSLPQWYDIQSFLSQSSAQSSKSDSADQQNSHIDFSNLRIVELYRRMSTLHRKSSSLVRCGTNTSYVFDLSYKGSTSPEKPTEGLWSEDVKNELKTIHLTIMTLLDYGADPNVARVPYPPLVMSLFTENSDLVMQLINANADVNVLVTDDDLSCLHIVSSLNLCEKNLEICRLLLLFKCNPNLKSSPTHWEHRKSYFTGNIPQDFKFEDQSKNALHLLCMRKDFENINHDYFDLMCKTLVEGGVDYDETYLGHTPLSMAVLSGNIKLVKFMIKLNIFDPYVNLAYQMGNIMTLFSLKRFENTLSSDVCKRMLTVLSEADVNVLYKVGDAENAIAFAEDGDTLFNLKPIEKDESGVGKGKAKPPRKPKKVDKSSQRGVISEFLKDLGRDMIIKRAQMVVTEVLYDFSEENMLDDTEIAIAMAEFLTPRIALSNLEVLFRSEKIEHDRLDLGYVKKFLNFVDLHKKEVKGKKVIKPPYKGKNDPFVSNATTETLDDLLALTSFKKRAIALPATEIIHKPGFDDPAIYSVCFHCLKGNKKELKLCPSCQLIRFCSVQCNKLNLKHKTRHSCSKVFYDMTDEEAQDITKGENLERLLQIAAENCRIRLHKKREKRLVEEELKLFEMWRADTYGTKFLKIKPLLDKAMKNREDAKPSLNLEALKKLMERNFQRNPADMDSYSIAALLEKLSVQHKMQETRLSTRVSLAFKSGSRIGSRLGSMFFDFLANDPQEEKVKEKPGCKCPDKMKYAKHKRGDKSGRQKPQFSARQRKLESSKLPASLPSQFEHIYTNVSVKETSTAVKLKLKKIPPKYQRFIEIMGTYFPDVDVSFWLLPYACCSNGQLFYKFCDNGIFRESYSFT